MTKIRLLRSRIAQLLMKDIASHLERYRTGTFDFLEADPASYFEIELEFDELKLDLVTCEIDDHKEVECCMAIYDSMGALPPYLARDPRIWVNLTHVNLLEYSRKRWPIPEDDEKAEAHIRKHFFANGTRGIERDNSASRLWWMASLCSRVEELTHEESLKAFLHQYDVRANIIERPTTSQSVPVFSTVIRKLHEALLNKDEKLFERERFRSVMKQLNLRGGVKLLGALDQETLKTIVEECTN
jgi:hypothetical protein